jgi:hypothetical protein
VSNTAGTDSDKQQKEAVVLEANTGIKVLRHSTKKPGCKEEVMAYFRAHPDAGVSRPDQIAIVGDRLSTDIMMANMMGSYGLWVRDGVTGRGFVSLRCSMTSWPPEGESSIHIISQSFADSSIVCENGRPTARFPLQERLLCARPCATKSFRITVVLKRDISVICQLNLSSVISLAHDKGPLSIYNNIANNALLYSGAPHLHLQRSTVLLIA